MAVSDNRPFFLNLLKIHLPVTGFVSFLHRISGLLLFIAIPFSVYLFDLSLQGSAGFEQAANMLAHPIIQLLGLLLIWSLLHHLFAGIRFLLTDLDIGLSKTQAVRSAWLVFSLELIVLILIVAGIKL
jgi:succinate dehydrogenase / fumarate reductase cytochrome b subunit